MKHYPFYLPFFQKMNGFKKPGLVSVKTKRSFDQNLTWFQVKPSVVSGQT